MPDLTTKVLVPWKFVVSFLDLVTLADSKTGNLASILHDISMKMEQFLNKKQHGI